MESKVGLDCRNRGDGLINMNFDSEKKESEEYPYRFYLEFLEYIKTNYNSQCWHVLPGEMASFWKERIFLK